MTPVVILPPEPPAPDVSLVELGDPDSSDRNGSSSPDLLAERYTVISCDVIYSSFFVLDCFRIFKLLNFYLILIF